MVYQKKNNFLCFSANTKHDAKSMIYLVSSKVRKDMSPDSSPCENSLKMYKHILYRTRYDGMLKFNDINSNENNNTIQFMENIMFYLKLINANYYKKNIVHIDVVFQ